MSFTNSELDLLISRIAKGDRAAFSDTYSATCSKLYGIILRILKNRQQADEVLQEVYIKLWQQADKYNPEKSSPMTWLCTIARNTAIDEIRRMQPATVTTDYSNVTPEKQYSPQHHALHDEALLKLNQCMEQLGTEQRSVIIQAYLEGYTRSELAQIHEKPVSTIKSWLRRGLLQLRDCLLK